MQLVLSNNRVIAHGENYLSMGGVVINTETGARYENATIAECENCPSDIGKVGYEYHGGVFKPCAPYGTGNNSGYFMEVCSECAVPRSSGIPIIGGLGRENLSIFPLLWENASPGSEFVKQTIDLDITGYAGFIVVAAASRWDGSEAELQTLLGSTIDEVAEFYLEVGDPFTDYYRREITISEEGIDFDSCYENKSSSYNSRLIPLRIYGVKL